MSHAVLINKEICIGCKACIEICPRDCFQVDDNSKAFFDSILCHSCGHCISVCPEGAISHESFSIDEYPTIERSIHFPNLTPDSINYFLQSIRSTRKFKTQPVPLEILKKLVNIVRFAPTGHHAQNVELTIVSDPALLKEIIAESKITIQSILRKINSPLYAFLALLIGKYSKIKEGRKSKKRFVRMLQGFEDGEDYLFHGAPVLVLFHARKKSILPVENCTIASTYLRILAESFGLGSCYIGYIVHYAKYNHKIPQILKIPNDSQLFQAIILGYPKYPFRRFVARNTIGTTWFSSKI